jgi:hypothetical protein
LRSFREWLQLRKGVGSNPNIALEIFASLGSIGESLRRWYAVQRNFYIGLVQ